MRTLLVLALLAACGDNIHPAAPPDARVPAQLPDARLGGIKPPVVWDASVQPDAQADAQECDHPEDDGCHLHNGHWHCDPAPHTHNGHWHQGHL